VQAAIEHGLHYTDRHRLPAEGERELGATGGSEEAARFKDA
jgi:hypothetical protein